MKLITNVTLLTTLAFLMAAGSSSAATTYSTALSGANENPTTGSAGIGTALVTLNGNSLNVVVNFSGLGTADQAGHIHCCGPIGVNEPVALPFAGFPTGVTSGSYSSSFDLTTTAVYTSAFLTASGGTAAGAETALIAGLNSGQTYVNIHTSAFPGGEIRGQLTASPEPGTMLLGGFALAAFCLFKRKQLAS